MIPVKCRDCDSTSFWATWKFRLLGPGCWSVTCGNGHIWLPADEVVIELMSVKVKEG